MSRLKAAHKRDPRLVVLIVPAILAACGDGPNRLSSGGDPPRDSTAVTILYPANDLGPSASAPIQYLVFLTLAQRNPSGDLEGRLARDWAIAEDGRGWTVYLRTDVRWHDGAPVTTRDVKFTLDLYAHPDVLAALPGAYEVRVLDDSTYTIRYAATAKVELPIGSPLDWYYPIYPEHLLRDEDPARFNNWEFWRRPIGNGPYRLVRRIPETALVLEANPDFYLGPPAIPAVILQSGGSSLVELQAGNVDAIASLSDSDVPMLRADDRVNLYYAFNLGSISSILWNQKRRPLNDPRVRRALTMAIDRRAILQLLNAPSELEPVDVLFTEHQFRDGVLPPGLAHDPDSARALLDAAGWVDGGGGLRERKSEPFRFSLLVSSGGGPWFPDHRREAVMVQADLREVGVDVEIIAVDASVGWERTQIGDFDAAIFDIKGGNRPLLFGPQSMIGYQEPRAAALIGAATREMDPGTRATLFEELGALLREDLPFTLLQPMVTWTAIDRRLAGLSSPWRADPAWYLDALWCEPLP